MAVEGSIYTRSSFNLSCAAHSSQRRRCEARWKDRPRLGMRLLCNTLCIRLLRLQVSADGKGFLKGIVLWFVLAIPSTYTNTMVCFGLTGSHPLTDALFQLRHLQSKLSLRARTRISRYTHDLYLSSHPNLRYYRLGLNGVVQYLTSDINSFCDALSGL